MTELDLFSTATIVIRFVNLVLWVAVLSRILFRDAQVSRLTRKLLCAVVAGGMAVLFLGAFVPYGFPGSVARIVYTAYTAYTALIALGIVSIRDDGPV